MLKVIKIGEREYRIGGIWERWETIDVCQLFVEEKYSSSWTKIVLDDLTLFGIDPIVFYDFELARGSMQEYVFAPVTRCRIANIYIGLQDEFKAFGNIEFYVDRGGDRLSFIKRGVFDVELFDWHPRWFLIACVPPDIFLSADFSKMHNNVKHRYEKLIPEIINVKKRFNDEQKFSIAHKLLKILISKTT